MKKLLLLSLGVALLGLASMTVPALTHANSSTLATPSDAGRPTKDSSSNVRAEVRLVRGLADCSLSAAASPTSPTSTPINLTSVAGLKATSNYPGSLLVVVHNLDLNCDIVAFLSMTSTAIGSTAAPAGWRIPKSSSATISAAARPGLTLHLQGVSNTGSVSAAYSVCNE